MVVQEVGEAGACLPGEELSQKLEGGCEKGTALLRAASRRHENTWPGQGAALLKDADREGESLRHRLRGGASGHSTAEEGLLQC